jgi:pimeloyl-ACP methyl ester carboxylesterase
VGQSEVDEVVAEIPGARAAIVRGAGHFMVREQPQQLARLVVGFLPTGL